MAIVECRKFSLIIKIQMPPAKCDILLSACDNHNHNLVYLLTAKPLNVHVETGWELEQVRNYINRLKVAGSEVVFTFQLRLRL